eukprot:1345233-Rhodomonas_salina.1
MRQRKRKGRGGDRRGQERIPLHAAVLENLSMHTSVSELGVLYCGQMLHTACGQICAHNPILPSTDKAPV